MSKLPSSVGVNPDEEKNPSSLESLSEDEVIALAARGDTEAFSVLYQRYVTRIYNYIYYRTGNPFEAEDLTSRVFHRALNHIQHYDNRGIPFSAWLYRIAHNLVANWHRDSNRHKEVPIEDQPRLVHHAEPPEHAVMNNQELESLMKVIRKLPAERQQLLILKFVEGLSNAEIAVIMMRSEGAIKSLYHRTLLALRDEIQKLEE
ncbi:MULTISPECIES: RNA polymerase sigma factor [Anaerolinea]|uniref:RNA polymerase ECF-type sigma factor n=1 Tax=Anaerolinea thermophila (strain DSM 14523 / JCM 11388 / NBRC 100420 / UNI-1) TaxID=926569 RepID=E8MXL9_ANATU|nr:MULTISPECIES: sigma-70 family RNA polymerase sigma factor [Anaerolinea]BAJ64100.1 RNA polymerase ECF-type sigma factor [Anaerolinea thermophila UNI-1]